MSLALPTGWTATPSGRAPHAVPSGASRQWQFIVTPGRRTPRRGASPTWSRPPTTPRGGRALSTHTRQQLTVAYPPGQTAPVGTWTMDEGSGTVAHDSSGAHDLTLAGAARVGCRGSRARRSASTARARTPRPRARSWTRGATSASPRGVRLDATGRFATAGQPGRHRHQWVLPAVLGWPRAGSRSPPGRAGRWAAQAPVTGRWYHLVGVHDANAGTYTLYVDGQAQPTVWHQSTGDAAGGPLAVGRGFSQSRPGDFWPGAVDQVHVWNRVLSGADVAALYSSGG